MIETTAQRNLKIYDLYVYEKLTMQEIAKKYRMTRQNVQRILSLMNAPRANRKKISDKDCAWIRKQTHKTNQELAKMFEVSEATISQTRKGIRHKPNGSGTALIAYNAVMEAKERLIRLGHCVTVMPWKSPYEFIVNGVCRVAVRAAMKPKKAPSMIHNRSDVYGFKVQQEDVDVHILCIKYKDFFIIPHYEVEGEFEHIVFSWPPPDYHRHKGKHWQKYHDRFDLIDECYEVQKHIERGHDG